MNFFCHLVFHHKGLLLEQTFSHKINFRHLDKLYPAKIYGTTFNCGLGSLVVPKPSREKEYGLQGTAMAAHSCVHTATVEPLLEDTPHPSIMDTY